MPPEFQAFPRMPRLSREIVITEKLDGTNAQIYISDDGLQILAGSRNRWIISRDDNYGFAHWVSEHKTELLALGPGRHFGEWWGAGIQRGYGLKEKRFSLFNVTRWETAENRPACCGVVPTLYRGCFSMNNINRVLLDLQLYGSIAAKGFMQPEGIVIYHTAAKQCFKKTIEHDSTGKPE